MKSVRKFVWFGLLFIGLSGCANFRSQPGAVSLEQFESLQSPSADKKQVEKRLGKPARITQARSGVAAKAFDVWIYNENGSDSPRMILFFEPHSGSLHKAQWYVHGGDSVSTFHEFSRRYPKAKFSKESIKPGTIVTSPLPPYPTTYWDTDLGLFIGASPDGNSIELVSWSTPKDDRQPTSDK